MEENFLPWFSFKRIRFLNKKKLSNFTINIIEFKTLEKEFFAELVGNVLFYLNFALLERLTISHDKKEIIARIMRIRDYIPSFLIFTLKKNI